MERFSTLFGSVHWIVSIHPFSGIHFSESCQISVNPSARGYVMIPSGIVKQSLVRAVPPCMDVKSPKSGV